jgi:hypothetical protein
VSKPRLTKTEKAAKEYCDYVLQNGSAELIIEWRKSRTWGSCPAALWRGQKLAYASGCGYDKESTVLADTLRFLFESGTPEHSEIWQCGGAGSSRLEIVLKHLGFTLKQTYSGKTEDGWKITKTA